MSNELFEFSEWAADNYKYLSDGLWVSVDGVVASTENLYTDFKNLTTTIPASSANTAINEKPR